jgi:hypothetical protein
MANYLDKSALIELDEYRKKIFALREEAYNKFKIDVLDNDTLSALSIYEIVSQYDSNYNINFSRNGEDGKSLIETKTGTPKEILIEQKASRIEKKKRSGLYPSAGFQFHAMGNIEYDRYIFAARDKGTLELIRIYDISVKENTKLVQKHLLGERSKWEDKNKKLGRTQKHDVIIMPEDVLISGLKNATKTTIKGVEVIKA